MDENDLRYKIMHESTMGWSLFDRQAQNLTKEEARKWLDRIIHDGINPTYLKAVLQDDHRYLDQT